MLSKTVSFIVLTFQHFLQLPESPFCWIQYVYQIFITKHFLVSCCLLCLCLWLDPCGLWPLFLEVPSLFSLAPTEPSLFPCCEIRTDFLCHVPRAFPNLSLRSLVVDSGESQLQFKNDCSYHLEGNQDCSSNNSLSDFVPFNQAQNNSLKTLSRSHVLNSVPRH